MRKICFYAIISAFFLLFFSCKTENRKQKPVSEKTAVVPPSFSADSACQFVAAQVNFGARVPNTEAHRRCAAYLAETLQRFGAEVTAQKARLQAYDGTMLDAVNIIGAFQPEKRRRILLCAHWDSRPFADHDTVEKNRHTPVLGANDGASGVGVLLEIARHLATDTIDVGIDLVFFDAEDYGAPENAGVAASGTTWCLGSQYWARNPHRAGYTAQFGILLDMVGAANATFYRDQSSEHFAPNIVDKVWRAAERLGFSAFFVNQTGGGIIDDHLFVNQYAGIPTIDIIHYNPQNQNGFPPTWHTINDDMQHIDKQTLNAVGTTLMYIIYNE